MPTAAAGHAPSFADALAAAHADTSASTSRDPQPAPPSAPNCSARVGALRPLRSASPPAAQRAPAQPEHATAAPAPRRSGVHSAVRRVPPAWVRLALVAVLLCTHTTLALFDPGEPVAASPVSSSKAAATLMSAALTPADGPLRTSKAARAATRDVAVAPRRVSIPPGCHRTTSFLADVCPAQGASATSSAQQLRSELVLCPLAPVAPLSLDKPVGDVAETTWAVSGTVTLPRDPQAVLDLDLGDTAGTHPAVAQIGEPSSSEAWPKEGEEGYWRHVGGTSHWVPAAVPLLRSEAVPSPSSDDVDGKPIMVGPREPTADEAREAYSIWSESVGGEGSDTWLSFAAWRAAYEEAQRDAAARGRDEQRKTKSQARRRDDGRDAETALNASSEQQAATLPSHAVPRAPADSPSPAPVDPDSQVKKRGSGDAAPAVNSSHSAPVTLPQGTDTGAVPAVGNPSSQLATLKHRWNFASLDCAAVVHRSNPSARFASSILSEKKDRYMLSPCPRRSEGQFVIVELCDEISIDTLVLANYEFFSRMFKRFRVRVARNLQGRDEEWQDIGTFRARNVRGLQVFNTVAPKSDARFFRYLRIDFLEHYGSEYYCPVSLLRVYGLTQMDDYIREEEELRREREQASDSASRELNSFDEIEYPDADDSSGEPGSGEQGKWQEWSERIDAEQTEHLEVVSGRKTGAGATDTPSGSNVPSAASEETSEAGARPTNGSAPSSASPLLTHQPPAPSSTARGDGEDLETALPSSPAQGRNDSPVPVSNASATDTHTRSSAASSVRKLDGESHRLDDPSSTLPPVRSTASPLKHPGSAPSSSLSAADDSDAASTLTRSVSSERRSQANLTAASLPSLSTEERSVKAAVNASSPESGRPPLPSSASSSSSAVSSSPSGSASPVASADGNGRSSAGASSGHGGGGSGGGGSESIYRTITKRLNALEANATLSLQYIEHSGQTLREVFARMERRQEERMGDMLRALNASNWRQIEGLKRRQQVDLQQAIFEFDVHRQQTDAERSRLVAELHILANEVLHEKRFGIAQLVLLLILFIFMALTRGSRTAPLINSGLARISGRTKRPKGSSSRQTDEALRTAAEPDALTSRRKGGHALARDRPEHMQHARQPSGGARVSATTREALRAVQDLTRGVPQKQLHVVRSASRSALPARLYPSAAADPGLGRTTRGALVEVPLHRTGSRVTRGRALRVSVPVPTRADFAEMSRDELGAWLGLLSPVNRSPQRDRSPPNQPLRGDTAPVQSAPERPRSRASSPRLRGAGHSTALTSGGEESMSSDWGTERSDDESAVSEDGDFDAHAARMSPHATEMPLGRDPVFGSQDTLADTNTLHLDRHLDRSATASPPNRSKLLSRMMNAARPSGAAPAPAYTAPEFTSPLSAAAGLESDADDEETAPRWIEVRPRRSGSCRDGRRNSGRPGSAASLTSPTAAPVSHYHAPGSPHSLGARTPLRVGTPSRSVPRSFASPAGLPSASDENALADRPEPASTKPM